MAQLLALQLAGMHPVKTRSPAVHRKLAEAALAGASAASRLDARDGTKESTYQRRERRERGVNAVLSALAGRHRHRLVGWIVDKALNALSACPDFVRKTFLRFLRSVGRACVPLALVPDFIWDILAGWIDGDGWLRVREDGRVEVGIGQALRGANVLFVFLLFFGGCVVVFFFF